VDGAAAVRRQARRASRRRPLTPQLL
jgi:hypothetical protein